jgi:hypothetical protein
MIAVDLSDIPPATVRYVPLNAWFRFRRAVEDTPTILMLLEQEPNAKTCASLVLRVGLERVRWAGMGVENFCVNASGCLLGGVEVRAEVVRASVQPIDGSATGADGSVGIFETEAAWAMRTDGEEGISNLKFEMSNEGEGKRNGEGEIESKADSSTAPRAHRCAVGGTSRARLRSG